MSSSARPPFSIAHGSWANIRPEDLGPRAQLRRVRGGSSEAAWLTLAVGAKLTTAEVTAECVLTVIEGRVACVVLGNELELPTGHYILLPPHVPFAMRTAGRSPATVLVHRNTVLPDKVCFEEA